MHIQTLIATMHRGSITDLNVEAMNVPGTAVVVNQCPETEMESRTELTDGSVMVTVDDSGLSRSRNAAIRLSTADLCAIADDDVKYLQNAECTIAAAFSRYPRADVICFMAVDHGGKPFRRYGTRARYLRTYNAGFVASVTIAFRRASIHHAGLRFDEEFGLGSVYPTGEEYVFLTDAMKAGLGALFLPMPIVVHGESSSGTDYRNSRLLTAKGAVFARAFGALGLLLIPAFFAKTVARRTEPSSWLWTLGYMIRGWLQYMGRTRWTTPFGSSGSSTHRGFLWQAVRTRSHAH